MRRALQVVAVLAMIWPTLIQAEEPVVTATWGAPTTGNPVDHYQLRLMEDGTVLADYLDIPGTSMIIPPGVFQPLREYTSIVRGIDSAGGLGIWSDVSPVFIWDDGPPGGCSAVEWVVQQ